MTIGGIENAMIGFALFDAWAAGMKQLDNARNAECGCGSPLVAAAFQAFEGYLATQEVEHAALIAGAATQLTTNALAGASQLATYSLNPQGTGAVITPQQMAPLLAMSIIA